MGCSNGRYDIDPKVLRDCVTKVTAVETSQALLVLRASVNGIDAGLLVVPEFMVDMNKMSSMDADRCGMGPDMGVTTICIVELTCGIEPNGKRCPSSSSWHRRQPRWFHNPGCEAAVVHHARRGYTPHGICSTVFLTRH